MKTFTEKNNAHGSENTASFKAAQTMQNPEGVDVMRRLLRQGTIAAQLRIGSPTDPAEIEADRMADAVVNNTGQSISLQENRTPIAPEKYSSPGSRARLPDSVINSGNARGLNTAEQTYFESRFNQDLGRIRIHEGAMTSHAASAINARAFTLGSDIYLKRGEYSFGSTHGKRLMAHELAHTLQPDNGVIRRWNGSEHRAFGNIAGGMVAKKSGAYMQALFHLTGSTESAAKTSVLQASALRISSERKKIDDDEIKIGNKQNPGTTQSMYINYKKVYPLAEYNKYMLLSTATELSGDHRKSKKDLAASSYGDAKLTDYALGSIDPRYLILASTNYNHFFPLAAKEWENNHEKAKDQARQANQAFGKAATDTQKRGHHISEGNRLLVQAMQYEAFGLHFLQDSFASGHQYPRALDLTQPTEFILSKEVPHKESTKTEWQTVYSFEEVTQLKEQGWTLMGTGDKSTGHKCRIYHDLLCALEQGIALRYPNESSHTPFHGDGTADSTDYPVAVETYNSMDEVLCTAFCDNKKSVTATKPTLPKGPNIPMIMEDKIAAPIWYAMEYDLARNFKANIGNKDTITREHTTDSREKKNNRNVKFTHNEVKEAWDKSHEVNKDSSISSKSKKILKSMESLRSPEYLNALKSWKALDALKQPEGAQFYIQTMGDPTLMFTNLDDNLVKFLKKETFPSTIPPNLCAYLIKLLIAGVCGDGDENAILKILTVQNHDNFFKIVLDVGISYLDKGIDGREWTRLLYMIRCRLQHQSISDNTATSLIKGLIETECWDPEEQLIITVLSLLGNSECTRVLDNIGLDEFDSGIDGAQWDEFLSVIMSKLPPGNNKGARQIAREKNDDAARRAVARLWAGGYKDIDQHLSPGDCIGLIKALLSGSCGDDDEDAIVLIVEYMVYKGQKSLINRRIGKEAMDRGVDWSQWTKVSYLMDWD